MMSNVGYTESCPSENQTNPDICFFSLIFFRVPDTLVLPFWN